MSDNTSTIRFSKIAAGHYVALDHYGNLVANINKSGTHLDDYPWDWRLEVPTTYRYTTGVSDTLRSAKQLIRSIFSSYNLPEGD